MRDWSQFSRKVDLRRGGVGSLAGPAESGSEGLAPRGALLGLELQTAPHTVLLGPLPACVFLLMPFPCPRLGWRGSWLWREAHIRAHGLFLVVESCLAYEIRVSQYDNK